MKQRLVGVSDLDGSITWEAKIDLRIYVQTLLFQTFETFKYIQIFIPLLQHAGDDGMQAVGYSNIQILKYVSYTYIYINTYIYTSIYKYI